jgi:methylphosphotriester-DNA--protein-cysteine methyltransferase
MSYKTLENGQIVLSDIPGKYAGHSRYKIFGRLDCKSGMRMKKENRVFFHELEDAVLHGYRPCRLCRPISETDFQRIKDSVPFKTLEEFYHSGIRFG